MKPQQPITKDCEDNAGQDRIPDESRRKLLSKLGTAAILVPAVTLISDASTNVAAAS